MQASGTPTPYATVIVPTHDRAATLPLALAAITRQTVSNIEIVISGDGVTDEVRKIARDHARADARIVFHDFPKAPRRGGANRDRAVQLSKSDRIFYSDDDDLLLPYHVEKLGPVLDRHDAADSSCAFVSRGGSVQVGLVNHERGSMRDALAAGQAKAVFDTHFAHRKSAYQRVGNPWAIGGTRIVADFFQAFATNRSISWKTIPEITALSFNGRTRQAVRPDVLRAELESWSHRLADRDWQNGSPHYDWHVFARLHRMQQTEISLEDFLRASFIRLNGVPVGAEADVAYSISTAQFAELETLFKVWNRQAVDHSACAASMLRLADPLIGWPRPGAANTVENAFAAALGENGLRAALGQISGQSDFAREIQIFLLVHLLFKDGHAHEALDTIERLIASDPLHLAEAHVQASLVCRKLGRSNDALDHALMAIATDPKLKTGYQLAALLLRETGRLEEARMLIEKARVPLPDHIVAALVATLAVPTQREGA